MKCDLDDIKYNDFTPAKEAVRSRRINGYQRYMRHLKHVRITGAAKLSTTRNSRLR